MSSTGYLSFPVDVDYDSVLGESLDTLTTNIPGFVPREGQLEVQLLEVLARMYVEAATVSAQVPIGIFRWFGRNLVSIQPVDAAKATAPSTWTANDTDGHTIKSGTVVGMQKSGDENLFFTVQSDVVIAPGSTTTSTDEVTLVAIDAGVNANGIPAGTSFLVDALSWVNTITTSATTSGGVEAELDSPYLNRLASKLKILTNRPILPGDFAALALDIPGVARAHDVDGYNPADSTYNNERMIAVALVNESGAAVSGGIKTAVEDYLESLREINFVVNAINPTFQTINVTVTLHKLPTADTTVVHDNAVAALTDYLSPNNWDWKGTVRVNELISLLDQVAGVDYVSTPTVPASDVTLSGAAPLAQVGTISVTVL